MLAAPALARGRRFALPCAGPPASPLCFDRRSDMARRQAIPLP